MKRTAMTIVALASLVVVVLIVTTFTTVSTANAQLGNAGVPVRCMGSANVGSLSTLTCRAADGTLFGGGTAVPAGHYLMVTDVRMSPGSGGPSGSWIADLIQTFPGGTTGDSSYFRAYSLAVVDEHYNSPILVLSQGQYLQMFTTLSSTGRVDFEVFGLLTTSYNYLPMITR